MFGLTIEKLFVVMLCATLIIGPQRLPLYAGKIAGLVRGLRGYVDATKNRAEGEMGVTLNRADWEALDLRRYDPRALMRDALVPSASPADGDSVLRPAAEERIEASAPPAERTAAVEPRGRWVVRGDAAHPRRVFIPEAQGAIDAAPQHDVDLASDAGSSASLAPESMSDAESPDHRRAVAIDRG